MKKVAIVGGGPAGVFCALMLCELSKNVELTLFERDVPLKTLLPTGGGRCNLTYEEWDFKEFAKNYPRGEKFLYSVFSRFFLSETLDFFSSIGVKTYTQEDLRVFPASNSASCVRKAMLEKLKTYKNVKIVQKHIKNRTELNEFDIIALSTGSKGGYDLARALGHTITPLASALCGYVTKQKYPSGVVLETPNGPVLFTHQGVSGPFVYKHSSLNAFAPFPRVLELPLFSPDELFAAIKQNPKKSFLNILCEFIPRSLAKKIAQSGELQACHVKKEEIFLSSKLVLDVVSVDNKGETVKAGGVCLDEINPDLSSKICADLYFCGEILDVDGFCGGFNLQNCWSTAAVAAKSIAALANRQVEPVK